MIRRPPRSTRTDTLFPYTTLFRSNTFEWLITFLDDSPPGDLDYALSLIDNSLVASDGTTSVFVERVVAGEVYDNCVGDQKVPKLGGLTTGRDYYVRVFAVNAAGYSLPQYEIGRAHV